MFYDTLNTFLFMVIYCQTWLKTRETIKGICYMHHSTDKIALTMTFVKPAVQHWLEWVIAQ